jgi:hypothetical protein
MAKTCMGRIETSAITVTLVLATAHMNRHS